jgi:hypothetical protein
MERRRAPMMQRPHRAAPSILMPGPMLTRA